MAKHTQIWFRKVRGSYLPTGLIGNTIYLFYVAYIVALAVDWFHLGHHVWTMLTAVIPLGVLAAVLMQYIASKHSK